MVCCPSCAPTWRIQPGTTVPITSTTVATCVTPPVPTPTRVYVSTLQPATLITSSRLRRRMSLEGTAGIARPANSSATTL